MTTAQVSKRSRNRPCLFCANAETPFTKEEHILPFSLGNNPSSGLVSEPLVLPPGIVCDKCNGRHLARVDQALIEWPPVSVFRSLAQVPNRRGGLVDAVQLTQWDVELESDDPRNFVLSVTADTGPGSRRDDVARALCKIALETRYLEDPLDARHQRWDEVRGAAIGGTLPTLTMWLTHPAGIDEVDLTADCGLLCSPAGALKLVCRVSVVGLTLHLFAGTPAPAAAPGTAVWRMNASGVRLLGPDRFWGHFHGRADSATRQTIAQRPPAGVSSGRHASRLPSKRPGTTIEIQRPGK